MFYYDKNHAVFFYSGEDALQLPLILLRSIITRAAMFQLKVVVDNTYNHKRYTNLTPSTIKLLSLLSVKIIVHIEVHCEIDCTPVSDYIP